MYSALTLHTLTPQDMSVLAPHFPVAEMFLVPWDAKHSKDLNTRERLVWARPKCQLVLPTTLTGEDS